MSWVNLRSIPPARQAVLCSLRFVEVFSSYGSNSNFYTKMAITERTGSRMVSNVKGSHCNKGGATKTTRKTTVVAETVRLDRQRCLPQFWRANSNARSCSRRSRRA